MFNHMSVISIAIQKGGSGKTTTAVNLGAALMRKGHSVLLIDSDPQANLTYSLGVADDLEINLYTEYKKEIMGQKSILKDSIVKTNCGLDLIPSSIDLANAELELVSKFAREQTLRNRMLRPLVNDYDYILIDCPPSFGMLTVNALVASDYIIVPLQGEFLPKKGVESFLKLIATMKEVLNAKTEVAGFVLTRFSPSKKMNAEVREWLEENFHEKLFKTFIHTDIRLATAQKKGQDIFSYSNTSIAANDYESLALEFLQRIPSEKKIQAKAYEVHTELN
jgi:chromosome partitioning protein